MSEEEQRVEEYKQLANSLKDQGNEAFQAGNTEHAIALFTQAIDLDPDNHVFYSNRSAAYMKADSISKALHDAERCVELAPEWAKGYNRLGVAQQSLGRFEAALTSFKKSIELDKNNKSYWAALTACEDASRLDKQQRFKSAEQERKEEEQRQKRRDEIREEMMREKSQEKEEDLLNDFLSDINHKKEESQDANAGSSSGSKVDEDDLLASFFLDVTRNKQKEEQISKLEEVAAEKTEEGNDKEISMTEKYVQQDLGSSKQQVERLLANHYQWRNLNPYYVLQLDTDATIEDIKYRYKKMSLKVHPDRLRDMENARDAFEQVKDAYAKLMDDDQRNTIVLHIENVTDELKKDRKKLILKGALESDLPPYEEEREKRLMKHFAELEHMRRKSDQNRRSYSNREKMQETIDEEQMEKRQEFEKNWAEEDRRKKRVGNWRDFQDVPEGKKVRATNYKEEHRDGQKFGKVQLESWKKSWK